MTGPVTHAIQAMRTEPEPPRRGFLRGLLTLPLIGGGVTLIGSPSAVAEPVSLNLMRTYAAWLAREHGLAHDQYLAMLAPEDRYQFPGLRHLSAPIQPIAGLVCSHWPADPAALANTAAAEPSTRAALVLSAVGCDWRR